MKRGLLIASGIAFTLIIVAVVAVYLVWTNLGSIIVAAVERFGSEATQTEVSLGAADIDIATGQGALRSLVVGNPKGYDTDSAFSLGEISVALDPRSVTTDTIIIKEIVVNAPQVTYELTDKGSNIGTIKSNVEAFAGTRGSKSSAASGEAGKPGKKLIIDNLYIRNGVVRISAVGLRGKKLNADMPDIHLKAIGRKRGGATPGQVAEVVIAALSAATGTAVSRLNIDALTQGVGGAAELMGKGTGGRGQRAIEAMEEGAKDAKDALQRLLGD